MKLIKLTTILLAIFGLYTLTKTFDNWLYAAGFNEFKHVVIVRECGEVTFISLIDDETHNYTQYKINLQSLEDQEKFITIQALVNNDNIHHLTLGCSNEK